MVVVHIPGTQPDPAVPYYGVQAVVAYDTVTGLINVRAGNVPGGVEGSKDVIMDTTSQRGDNVDGDE